MKYGLFVQTLTFPSNKVIITAGYKNKAYENLVVNGLKMGTHYGIDFSGDTKLYASGDGKIINVGYDEILGNFVAILYNSVLNHKDNTVQDVIFRYFHLKDYKVKQNQSVSQGTEIATMGNTGKYTTGVHCHIEVDTDIKYWNYTPTLSGNSNIMKAGLRGSQDTTQDPMNFMFKNNFQTISTSNDAYTNNVDKIFQSAKIYYN